MEDLRAWVAWAAQIWSIELFSLDGHPMTIGKMLAGIVLLVAGHWLAKRSTDAVDRRFFSRMEMEASVRYALKRALFYFLFAVATLFTLRTLNFPLTIFTVLGGALAIGFGFGSQNIVNNFISGVIIMIERPIRVGDYIDVDGLRGTIEVIGIRATQVRTVENRQVILPNSFFLEKAVVNWTLSDDVVRGRVAVGVQYGSSTTQVRDLLLKIAHDQETILKDPPPKVLLADFADNALNFEILYWARMDGARMLAETESDVRFAIEEEFRKAGIGIPYPQRDVHLDTSKPLKVELHSPSGERR